MGGRRPGAAGDGAPASYHGRPVLKAPVWTWEVPAYFFAGGLAGASAGLAFAAGHAGHDVLARRTWPVALGALSASPALLISDLGRPERFLNMLRLVKPTSPMSVGSWILTAGGAATAAATVLDRTGRLPRFGPAAQGAAALFGLPLTTYTAVLVANTAVPAWHEARRTLPFAFAAGAAASAGRRRGDRHAGRRRGPRAAPRRGRRRGGARGDRGDGARTRRSRWARPTAREPRDASRGPRGRSRRGERRRSRSPGAGARAPPPAARCCSAARWPCAGR